MNCFGDYTGIGAGSDSSPTGLVGSTIFIDSDLMRGSIRSDRNGCPATIGD